MSSHVTYNLYPSLLDSYQDYLNSEDTWLKYWGNSETPSVSLENFERKQLDDLIGKINRVPVAWEDTEKRDRGTAFNEVVDCLILRSKSPKMDIKSDKEAGTITAAYNERTFSFPIVICREFADYFKGATPQVFCEGILPTKRGDVRLYGYIDEVMPTAVHDIKVTGNYEAWKFKDKWQRVVYPFCMNEMGAHVTDFEYNILLIKESKTAPPTYETITEYYNYTEGDKVSLAAFVEGFIDFVESNRALITDTKIFNQ